MRPSLAIALLLSLAGASCRRRPATESPRDVATESASRPSPGQDGCGIVARLDIQALAQISPARTLDGFWGLVLPAGAGIEAREAVVDSTRGATLCRDFGHGHRREFGLVLEGDYRSGLLDRLMRDRPGFARSADGRAFVSSKITVAQRDERHLIVAPTAVGESWAAGLGARAASRASLAAISLHGDALLDVVNAQSGVHPRELDGVTAIDGDVAADGKALSIRLSVPDGAAAQKLAAAVSGVVADLRERAAKEKRPIPDIGVHARGSVVAVQVDLSGVDLSSMMPDLVRLIGNRRSAPLGPEVARHEDANNANANNHGR